MWGAVPGLVGWRCRKGETGFAAYSFCIYALALFRWDDSQKLDLLLRRVGAAMAAAMAMSSNTEAIGFTVGLCVYAMGLILPLSGAQKRSRRVVLVLACLMVGITFCSRVTAVFRQKQQEKIGGGKNNTHGHPKGLEPGFPFQKSPNQSRHHKNSKIGYAQHGKTQAHPGKNIQ